MIKHRRSLASRLSSLRRLWSRQRQESDRRGRRQAFLVETLESRNLMAGDLGDNLSCPSTSALYASALFGATAQPAVVQQYVAPNQDAAEGEAPEGEAQQDLVAFAKALTASGAKFYGAAWCPVCTAQKELFQDGAQYLPFVEVTNNNRQPLPIATQKNITTYPTWIFNEGTENEVRLTGQQTLAALADAADIEIPTGSTPSLAPIGNQTVLGGAPLWLGLDGYDPNGNTLTYTVTSSNPNLLQATVPTGNRSITIDVQGFGKMTFELFDHLVPNVTNRIVELIESGQYNKTDSRQVTFHRVIEDFMIQGGQYSPAPSTFDDQFHVDAQHTSKGLLALAKTAEDDSGTSQFYITDNGNSRHLDFNHPVFGRLIEGESVRDAINATATNGSSVPLTAVVINSITVNQNDTENGLLMLKAAHGASGTATVTVRATDAEGLFIEETFNVTVSADTKNTPAFLNAIPQIRTNVGQTVEFQLQGVDVENDALIYSATNPTLGTANPINYTLQVNSSTGVVTITPPAGFVGKLPIAVQVRDPAGVTMSGNQTIADGIDRQTIFVDVAPLPPTLIDLAASSDSGSSASDNVTNATTTSFEVTGVTAGAVVKLYRGTTPIGEGTVAAGQTSVTIQTTGVSSAGQGQHAISATQTVNGVESLKSTTLDVTFDSTPPAAFTSTPPTTATVGQAFSYNAANPEENTAGFKYELATGAPAGVVIDAATGVVTWTPNSQQAGAQAFTINAIDAAGNIRTQAVNLTVGQAAEAVVAITLRITDAQGNILTSLSSNQEFFLRAFVRDRRILKEGVAAGYMDVTWDASKAVVTGAITYGSIYTIQRRGDTSTPGLINEAGAFSGDQRPTNPAADVELFSVPMRATASGGLTFTADPADTLPANHVLLHGRNTAVLSSEVTYGNATAIVDLSFGAVSDNFNVNEDSDNFQLNPLANDTVGSNTLTITAVGTTSHGGTVTISQDGTRLLYSPADNFFGTETFTYTIKNQDDQTDTATITITVLPVNDNPVGVNDTFSVNEDSTNNALNVLANDTLGPDTGETLKVIAVGSGSAGGQLTIGPGNNNVLYTPPANFVGTETFTYTLSDGNGGLATATVTVSVTAGNDNPTAANDSFTVVEDSTNNTIDPLANDSALPDVGETITIQSVGTGSRGGTITISEDKTKLIYTPAANVQGTETFTYTISDGNGGTATATVTMTITNTNDPPTGVDDTVQAFKNTKAVFDVLANDKSDPDPAETLTISAVGTPSAGGTVAIVNGKIEYTPANNFTGTETFTYTVRDPGGLTDTVTVTVNVAEFIPSHISGYVYIDANGNGIKDDGEAPLSGVTITLSGTPTGGSAVTRTAVTSADGKYSFRDLAPATYTVKETTPAFMLDGPESVGSIAATISANDQFTINLPQGTDATNFNFGERGRTAATVSIRDLFASRSMNYLMVAVDTSTGSQWTLSKGGWRDFTNVKGTIISSGGVQSLKIEATNPQSQQQSTTIALPDGRVDVLGTSGNVRLYRVIGSPSAFGFTGGTTNGSLAAALAASDAALEEAEGEAADWRVNSDSTFASDYTAERNAVDLLLAAQRSW